MSKNLDPAIKSYFFGKGYRDLKKVIIDSWSSNISSAKYYFSKIGGFGEEWKDVASFFFFGGTGVSIIVFGSAVFLLLSFVHISLLIVIFSLTYIGFSVVYFSEKVYFLMKHFFSACPFCHEKHSLPEYLCPTCGVAHFRLTPNSFGILHHRCKCGDKLPCTFFLNRGELQARCPNKSCNQLLDRNHIETKRVFIPILGGASSGKSAFLFSAVRELIDNRAAMFGLTTKFIDTVTEAEYRSVEKKLLSGSAPSKTLSSVPKAFNLALKKDNKNKCLLYLYDPAGESYQNMDSLSSHRYFEYLSGMILVIDPFSIPVVRDQYKDKLAKNVSINPSQLHSIDALDRVILTMEESFGLSHTSKLKQPLAVVLTKIDAFDLQKKIGRLAKKTDVSGPPTIMSLSVKSNLIKAQLIDWGESGLIQRIDTRFRNVRFFSCSSLSRTSSQAGSEFKSMDVFEPLEWILKTVESKSFGKLGD